MSFTSRSNLTNCITSVNVILWKYARSPPLPIRSRFCLQRILGILREGIQIRHLFSPIRGRIKTPLRGATEPSLAPLRITKAGQSERQACLHKGAGSCFGGWQGGCYCCGGWPLRLALGVQVLDANMDF